MSDDHGVLEDLEPVLQSSEGDEALILARREARKRWLGVAAGVGVGSAAVAAAMMFWGQKERTTKPAARSRRNTGPEAKAGAPEPNGDPRE